MARPRYLKSRYKQVGRGIKDGVPLDFALQAVHCAYEKGRINRSQHASWVHIIRTQYSVVTNSPTERTV